MERPKDPNEQPMSLNSESRVLVQWMAHNVVQLSDGEAAMTPFVMEVMDDAMSDVTRQKTEVERLRIAGRMWKSARVIMRGAILPEHPDWSVVQVDREIAHLISHRLVKHESD